MIHKRKINLYKSSSSSNVLQASHRCNIINQSIFGSIERQNNIKSLRYQIERRKRLRIMRLREYQRLRSVIPSIANKKVTKIAVIEEAVRYIDHLHSVFLDRIKTKGLPKCFHDINIDIGQLNNLDDIQKLVTCYLEKK